jgi:hypothetical protein
MRGWRSVVEVCDRCFVLHSLIFQSCMFQIWHPNVWSPKPSIVKVIRQVSCGGSQIISSVMPVGCVYCGRYMLDIDATGAEICWRQRSDRQQAWIWTLRPKQSPSLRVYTSYTYKCMYLFIYIYLSIYLFIVYIYTYMNMYIYIHTFIFSYNCNQSYAYIIPRE